MKLVVRQLKNLLMNGYLKYLKIRYSHLILLISNNDDIFTKIIGIDTLIKEYDEHL